MLLLMVCDGVDVVLMGNKKLKKVMMTMMVEWSDVV